MKKSSLLGVLSTCVALLLPYSVANSAPLSVGDIIATDGKKVIAYNPTSGTSTTIITDWTLSVLNTSGISIIEVVDSQTAYAITGIPNTQKAISRFNPTTGEASVLTSGFHSIFDIEVGTDGHVYALILDSSGQDNVIKIDANTGQVTQVAAGGILQEDASAPTGLAIDSHNNIHVLTGAILGSGRIVTIDPATGSQSLLLDVSAVVGLSNLRRGPEIFNDTLFAFETIGGSSNDNIFSGTITFQPPPLLGGLLLTASLVDGRSFGIDPLTGDILIGGHLDPQSPENSLLRVDPTTGLFTEEFDASDQGLQTVLSASVVSSISAVTLLRCDLNDNGEVDAGDLLQVLRMTLGYIADDLDCDINNGGSGDGVISTADVVIVTRIVLGIIPAIPN